MKDDRKQGIELIAHIKCALTLATNLGQPVTGYLIEHALDEAKWPMAARTSSVRFRAQSLGAERLAELQSTRDLLSAVRVRAEAILAVGHKVLTYLTKKFADNWVGALATAALAALGRLTGLW